MAFEKGHKKVGGRKKGSTNKLSASVKDAVMKAFDSVGGDAYLQKIAAEDPRTFCTLLGKVLPSQISAEISGKDDSPIKTSLEITFVKPEDVK